MSVRQEILLIGELFGWTNQSTPEQKHANIPVHAIVKLLSNLIFTYIYISYPCIKNQFHMKFHEFS